VRHFRQADAERSGRHTNYSTQEAKGQEASSLARSRFVLTIKSVLIIIIVVIVLLILLLQCGLGTCYNLVADLLFQ